tara:strand:- start:322 stop:672 length:351 start_codon:yes stop_codon:yes gene_type:complete
MKKKINNYQFQQQSKRKRDYEKLKKIQEVAKKIPEDATEELEYVKKLLSGEDVGDFGPEEIPVETNDMGLWFSGGPMTAAQVQAQLQAQLVQELQSSRLSLSELLSIGTVKQRKKL